MVIISPNRKLRYLFKAIISLKNETEAKRFFQDLCTFQELNAMADRLEIARLLKGDKNYRDIAERLKVSTTTVSRVARWLKDGEGGYDIILKRNG